MKRYMKPELFFENYELTHHIAGNCSAIPSANGATTAEVCEMDIHPEIWGNSGGHVFLTSTAACDEVTAGNDDYCYTVSTETWIINNS